MQFAATALLGAILTSSVDARGNKKSAAGRVSAEYAVCELLAEDDSYYGDAKMIQADTRVGLSDIHWRAYIDQGLSASEEFALDLWSDLECGGDKEMSFEAGARPVINTTGVHVYSTLDGGIVLSEITDVMSLGLLVDGAQVACCNID